MYVDVHSQEELYDSQGLSVGFCEVTLKYQVARVEHLVQQGAAGSGGVDVRAVGNKNQVGGQPVAGCPD